MAIHPTAVIDGDVEIGPNVSIGPFAVLSGRIRVGAKTLVGPGVTMTGWVDIGEECAISPGCHLGGPAQNFTMIPLAPNQSGVRVGQRVVLREGVTINAATVPGKQTTIGDGSTLMVGAHVGHDCEIGAGVTVGNRANLAGGVQVHDCAMLAGCANVNTDSRIGRGALVDATSLVLRDVPPFMRFSRREMLAGIRAGAMRGAGIPRESIEAYEALYLGLRRGTTWAATYADLRDSSDPFLREIRLFLKRSICGITACRRAAGGRRGG